MRRGRAHSAPIVAEPDPSIRQKPGRYLVCTQPQRRAAFRVVSDFTSAGLLLDDVGCLAFQKVLHRRIIDHLRERRIDFTLSIF